MICKAPESSWTSEIWHRSKSIPTSKRLDDFRILKDASRKKTIGCVRWIGRMSFPRGPWLVGWMYVLLDDGNVNDVFYQLGCFSPCQGWISSNLMAYQEPRESLLPFDGMALKYVAQCDSCTERNAKQDQLNSDSRSKLIAFKLIFVLAMLDVYRFFSANNINYQPIWLCDPEKTCAIAGNDLPFLTLAAKLRSFYNV